MEGLYQATQSNLWDSVSCQGPQGQPSIAANAAVHEASAQGLTGGAADGTLGILDMPPVIIPYNHDSTGYTALPSGLCAALDELAAAIGITMEAGAPPAPHAAISALILEPQAAQHLDSLGPACIHTGSSAPPAIQTPGNASTALSATGVPNPASGSAALPDQVMCVQGAQPLQLVHLQPPNPAQSLNDRTKASMASCLETVLAQPESVPPGITQPAQSLVLPGQAQHLDRQNLPEQPKLGSCHLGAAPGGTAAAVTTALPLPPSWTGTEAVGSALQALDTFFAGQPPVVSQTPLMSHQREHNALAVEQLKVQLTAPQLTPAMASQANPQPHGSAQQQAPQPAPAIQQPFKAPTVAMLRAMRNSSISASTAAVTASCMPVTTTSTDARGLPAGTAACKPELPPGAQTSEVAASSSALCNRGQELGLLPGEPQIVTVWGAIGAPVVPAAEPHPTTTPASPNASAPFDACSQLLGPKLVPCIQAAPSGLRESVSGSSAVLDGVADAAVGPSNANSIPASASTDHAAGAAAPLEAGKVGQRSVGAAAEGLPSLLSADPEELAAAIAAAVAAVAAATRATTEAADQSTRADQQPSQPQLQAGQLLTEQPFAQQVLLPAVGAASNPHVQDQQPQPQPQSQLQYPQQPLLQQHHQQSPVFTAMPSYDPTAHLQFHQLQQQQPQPQQLQVQFVPAGDGSGVLQVVAYAGSHGGAALPLVSEGLPLAAAALLGTGLPPAATVTIGGQVHSPLQQLQYGEVVQVAWPGPSGPVPATVVYSPPGGYHHQQQPQQQQTLDALPQVQDAYAHQVHDERYHQYGAGDRQQQQSYTLYDYDNRNPPPHAPPHAPQQQPHYGSGHGAYDSRHEAPRHPTPYIYRPPAANTAADACRDSQPPDPRTARPNTDPRPGYVPLRHRAPSASSADGWHSASRCTRHRQHPQHLLWSPPPSVLYTPTREYEDNRETPPPEVTDGDEGHEEDEPAAGAGVTSGIATASAEGEGSEAGSGKAKTAGIEVNGVSGAARASSPAADEGSQTLAAAQQRGPCSATVAAIQLIEARRKQAQAKEQMVKEQKVKEQQEKEQQQHAEEQQNKYQQVKLPKVKDLPIKEVQTKGQQQPKPDSEPQQAPTYLDTQERLPESGDEVPEQKIDDQPAAATADTEAAPQPQPQLQLQRPGPATSGRGLSTLIGHEAAPGALEPKPLGRNKEQARAEQDAATQAMLEKARRLRQQQLQERIQQERQRKEQEELRKQSKEQEEERLRDRLRERLSQQQRAKAGGTIGPGGLPVPAKPQGNVAAALAAKLAAAGRDALGGAAVVTAAEGAPGAAGSTAAGAVSQAGGAGAQGTHIEANLQELEADLAALEQQIASAPTYGVNPRAFMLRAAELVAKRDAARALAATGAAAAADPKPPPEIATADAGPGLISVVKPLADAVPLPERVFVTYVPRSSIPRLLRQEAAHSLTGGYLALALQRARVSEARAVQAVTNEPELRKAAVAAAGQHEMALYRQVTSKMNYALLFRKSKAEPERLQLSEDVVQLLIKKYGSGVKGKSPAGGSGAPTALAAPKAAGDTGAARLAAAASASAAGSGDVRSVISGTKRRLVPPDDASPPSALAAAVTRDLKRLAAAGAAGAVAPAGGIGARKVTPAGGSAKAKHAVRRREDDASDRAASGTRAMADAVVDELFVDSGSGDEDISGRRIVGGSEADAQAATWAVGKDVKGIPSARATNEAKKGDAGTGPVDNALEFAMGTAESSPGGGNGKPGKAAGDDHGTVDEGSPDAPYEDLFGSDMDSGQEGGEEVYTAKSAEGLAQTPVVYTQGLQRAQVAASAGCSSGPAVGSAPPYHLEGPTGPKVGAAAGATSGTAAVAEDGGISPPAPVQNIDASTGGTTHVCNRKRQRVDEGGDAIGVGDCDVGHRGRTEGPGLDKEPSRQSHVREKRRRGRSRSRSEGRPHGGDEARGLESKVFGGGGRQGSLPLRGRGSSSVLCSEDGRQDAQGEGYPSLQHQQQSMAAAGSLSRAGMPQEEWEQTEARQKLRQQVLAFIHATLEPLYRAGLLGKESYKRAAAKTCERLMSAHPDDITADFLVREHAQVSKFIMKVVEREQQRDAEQQEQKLKQAK